MNFIDPEFIDTVSLMANKVSSHGKRWVLLYGGLTIASILVTAYAENIADRLVPAKPANMAVPNRSSEPQLAPADEDWAVRDPGAPDVVPVPDRYEHNRCTGSSRDGRCGRPRGHTGWHVANARFVDDIGAPVDEDTGERIDVDELVASQQD